MRKIALSRTTVRLALPLSILAAAGLAACATDRDSTASAGSSPMSAKVKSETIAEYQPGTGVIQSVTRAPMMETKPGTSGAAGDTRADTMYRLAIRMESGGVQYVDSQERYPVGTRVELTPEKYIRQQ